MVKEYDVVVIGSGAGASIVENAVNSGLKVALIDKGPTGGTCLNVGCIPSKMLIAVADRIMKINESDKFGLESEIKDIDFKKIMSDMRKAVEPERKAIYKNLKQSKEVDFYDEKGEFISENTLKIGEGKIKGKKIFIVSGARPLIPDIKGVDEIDYFTNETLLELKKIPKSMIIVGGGYIACEYAHFFSAIGTNVTIFQKSDKLVPNEEPEISDFLFEKLSKRMKVHLNAEVTELKNGKEKTIIGKQNGKEICEKAEEVLIAAGRKSNADLLKVEKAGIKLDERGYIKVNECLKTNKENIWAFGDVIGKAMFTHVSRREAEFVWHNSMHGKKMPFDYSAVPHTVFTYPEIASVGLTEKQAEKNQDILIGKAFYKDVAKGEALRSEGFAKAIIDRNSGNILGFHIIGEQASVLIQEVVNAISNGANVNFIGNAMHIHPSLSELITLTLNNLEHPK